MPDLRAVSRLISHQKKASEASNISLGSIRALHSPIAGRIETQHGEKTADVVGEFDEIPHEKMLPGEQEHRQR